MDYKVYPLSFTQANWEIYIKLCQEILGYSPTRGLDETGINAKSAPAFLATLDLKNQPRKNLARGVCKNNSFHHVHCGFILASDESFVFEILNYTELKVIFETHNRKTLVILTGSMFDWYKAILRCCSEEVSYDCRMYFNNIKDYFESAGFKDVWSRFETRLLVDGSLVINS